MAGPESDLSHYHFELPEELIAQWAMEPRDSSRLLVLHRAEQRWEHRRFTDLPGYLNDLDCLVVNNTRVMRARLLGQRLLPDGKLGGRVEFLMLDELEPNVWEGAFHASAKARPGLSFEIPTSGENPAKAGPPLRGEILRGPSESPSGTVVARFDRDPRTTGAGEVPLPPYMDRAADASDLERYQTIYSRPDRERSAAAPTAGLHFTPAVRADLEKRGVGWEEVTLNVGLGTFRPVKARDIREHVMHEEKYEISPGAAERINAHRARGGRIVAVGTTAVRTLESAFIGDQVQAGTGATKIFIYPGAAHPAGGAGFRMTGALITNFHLPQSTLFMLVCAFAGRDLTQAAYAEAIREKYRFYSYGDAMLIV